MKAMALPQSNIENQEKIKRNLSLILVTLSCAHFDSSPAYFPSFLRVIQIWSRFVNKDVVLAISIISFMQETKFQPIELSHHFR